jgi:lipopolysaccharide transport system ATP-binding protein
MSTVIKVENLSKRYRLGVINRDMLYKDLQSRWAKFRGKEDPNAPIGFKHDKRLEHGDEFWALRNVDLEVKEGEILGIIGRNGAGKSTLLKILSQITAPTDGRIKVKGRIASLLEVGTGFHPELTGRENVFLNGAILGMTRKEVRSKFDEIVAFAEIDEFIDTPVKRYSSGMYVRLAFAVAAHLDPEILIVDEVLAVGDASFQHKCLGKMQQVSERNGRTVVFVSHNMGAVRHLCDRTILISDGNKAFDGSTEAAIDKYIENALVSPESLINSLAGPLAARISKLSLKINGNVGHSSIRPHQEIVFDATGTCSKQIEKVRFSINIQKDSVRVCSLHDLKYPDRLQEGHFAFSIKVSPYQLRPGRYTVGIGGHDGGVHSSGVEWLHADDVATFDVTAEWCDKNDYAGIGIVNVSHKGNRLCLL